MAWYGDLMQNIGDWLARAPWRDRSVSLIYIGSTIAGERSGIDQEYTLAGKRQLIEDAMEYETSSSLLLATWHGEYRTDARVVPRKDWEAVRDALS